MFCTSCNKSAWVMGCTALQRPLIRHRFNGMSENKAGKSILMFPLGRIKHARNASSQNSYGLKILSDTEDVVVPASDCTRGLLTDLQFQSFRLKLILLHTIEGQSKTSSLGKSDFASSEMFSFREPGIGRLYPRPLQHIILSCFEFFGVGQYNFPTHPSTRHTRATGSSSGKPPRSYQIYNILCAIPSPLILDGINQQFFRKLRRVSWSKNMGRPFA